MNHLGNLQRGAGLGFLDPTDQYTGGGYDYWSNFDPVTGDWIGSEEGTSGGDYWSNFDPVTGDWIGSEGGASGGDYWSNFDPITGDWIGYGGYETFATIPTLEPAALPGVPTEQSWWDSLLQWFQYSPPSLTPVFDTGEIPMPPAPPGARQLPGYCPAGTYHPVSNPYSCVPFPPGDPRSRQQQQAGQQPRGGQQPRAGQQPQRSTLPQLSPCPPGQTRNSQGKCVAIPKCPPGMQFNPRTGQCQKPGGLLDALKEIPPTGWLLAVLALLAIGAASRGESSPPQRRGRR